MNPSSITSVITEGARARCITATATIAPGNPGISILGVTGAAARDICFLLMAAAKRHGIRLPRKAVTIELVFDVPFERTSELAFTALLSIAGTICPNGFDRKRNACISDLDVQICFPHAARKHHRLSSG